MKRYSMKLIDEVMSKNFLKRLLIMSFFVFILSINLNLLLVPNELVIGGTSGLATLVNSITGIEAAKFIFCFNSIFIILSFFLLDIKESANALIGSLLYPLFVSITGGMCLKVAPLITFDNYLIMVILSALIYGVCNGFIYKTGFSTGGIDILNRLINKYMKIPRGTSSMIINMIIICSATIFLGLNKAVYAIIVILINSTLVDKIMLGISNSKTFYIRTHKQNEVIRYINSLDSGYTVIKTEGKIKSDDNMIMCVINNADYYLFTNVLKEIDPNVFYIISDCYQVYGGQRKEKFPFI